MGRLARAALFATVILALAWPVVCPPRVAAQAAPDVGPPQTVPRPPCASDRDYAKLRQMWMDWRLAEMDVEQAAKDAEAAQDAYARESAALLWLGPKNSAAKAALERAEAALAASTAPMGSPAEKTLEDAIAQAAADAQAANEDYLLAKELADRAMEDWQKAQQALDSDRKTLQRTRWRFERELARLRAKACPPPPPPPPPAEESPCPACALIDDEISVIDLSLEPLRRSVASMKRHADLGDPNVQRAIREDERKIAELIRRRNALVERKLGCEQACVPGAAGEPASDSVLQGGVLGGVGVAPPPAKSPNGSEDEDELRESAPPSQTPAHGPETSPPR